jgi:hypothetical protein
MKCKRQNSKSIKMLIFTDLQNSIFKTSEKIKTSAFNVCKYFYMQNIFGGKYLEIKTIA